MELVNVIDENGNITSDVIDKLDAHRLGICHGISAIGIVNSYGKLLLQKRVKTKKLEPDKWDLSGAGHIDINETPEEAAIRETYEELGVTINKDELKLLDTFLLKKKINDCIINHFTYIYIVRKDIDIDKVKFNENEVSEIKYVNKEEYLQLLNNNKVVYGIKLCDKIINYIN